MTVYTNDIGNKIVQLFILKRSDNNENSSKIKLLKTTDLQLHSLLKNTDMNCSKNIQYKFVNKSY